MSISYSNFFLPVVLDTTVSTLCTVPANPASTLLRGARIRLTNTAAAVVTGTLYAVPPAGLAADGNSFLKLKTVPANDYLDVDVPIMPAGATIQGLAGAATSLTAHMISGSLYA